MRFVDEIVPSGEFFGARRGGEVAAPAFGAGVGGHFGEVAQAEDEGYAVDAAGEEMGGWETYPGGGEGGEEEDEEEYEIGDHGGICFGE